MTTIQCFRNDALAITAVALASVAIGFSAIALAQDFAPKQAKKTNPTRPPQAKATVEPDGTVHMPAQPIPVSTFLSGEAKKYVIQEMTEPVTRIADDVTGAPFAPRVKAQMDVFAVDVKTTEIGGVKALIITPKQGIDARNTNRVLLNVHGGGYANLLLGQSHLNCFPVCAELESIPVSALGRFKVVTINYRQAPDFVYPTASDD